MIKSENTGERTRKSIGDHKRGGRTAGKYRETEATEKTANFSRPVPSLLGGEGEAKDFAFSR
jgi:hypothetical protein